MRFNHVPPKRVQNQPYPHVPPKYGAQLQYAKEADTTPLLLKEGQKFIQQVTSTFLYYARAVDLTMLAALLAGNDVKNMMFKFCVIRHDVKNWRHFLVMTFQISA